MQSYLLDTNIVSYLADRTSSFHQRAIEKAQTVPGNAGLSISILTLYELAYGYARNPIRSRVLAILSEEGIHVLPLTEAGAEVFAELKNAYRLHTGTRERELVRHNVDLMLAASAIAEGVTLVSNDAIFKRFAELEPRLVVENWAE